MFFKAIHELRERRVFQALAIYLGIAWGVVEFVSFIEERYLLSPDLTDLTLLALALLMPSIALLTYHHGKPGTDRWHRSEKVGVPVNVILAAAVLFSTFSGKSLGAVTTTLSITDENGRAMERVVPKAEFRKRIAIFDFDGTEEDRSKSWLRYGLSVALAIDLKQDLFIDMRCTCAFVEELRKAGYKDGLGIPLSLKKKIAKEKHLAYFVTGRVESGAFGTRLTVSLYETERGRLLHERSFSGNDPLSLVDEASVQLRRDLQIPARHIDETQDLPASELLSGSEPALRRFIEGYEAIQYGEGWSAAAPRFEQALELDPGFAVAELHRWYAYRLLNRSREANASLQALMQQLFRLTEPQQFDVKTAYYLYRQEPERAMAAARMRIELFPDDIDGYLALAALHQNRGEKAAAIAMYERVLEIDPEQHEYVREIGSLYERQGEEARALEYYGRYAKLFPSDHRAYLPLANLSRRIGRHDEARQYYEKALLLDPGNTQLAIRQAEFERDNGRFEEAERLYQAAIAGARTARDSVQSYAALRGYHIFRGRMKEALRYNDRVAAAARSLPPVTFTIDQLQNTVLYVWAGETETALRRLDAISREIAPPYDLQVPAGEILVHLEMDQIERADAAARKLEGMIEATSMHAVRPFLLESRGRVEAARGRCESAIGLYRQKLEMEPTDVAVHRYVGQCYHRMGNLAEAVRSFKRVLTAIPFDPDSNRELGRVYLEMGDKSRGSLHLGRALRVWSDADPRFEPAAAARREHAATDASVAALRRDVPW